MKSADAATRDNAGNIIQLDERFNEESDDIRFSSVNENSPDSLTFTDSSGSIESEVVNANDNGRVRKVSSRESEELRDNRNRYSSAAGNAQESKEWRNLPRAVQKSIQKEVSEYIGNSPNYDEAIMYILDGTGKTIDDISIEEYNAQIKKTAATLYETAMQSRVLAENKFKYLGSDGISKLIDRIISKADEQNLSTVNSAGEQLSEGQQEYFKDSKVRDENGNLLVVYHGTPAGGFSEFMLPEYLSKITSRQGAGYYFTDERNAAQYQKAYNGKTQKQAQLYKVYLNITNPLEITEFSKGKISPEAFREIISRGTRQWGVEHTDVEKILSWNLSDADLLQEMVSAYTGDSILPVMRDVLGYDGVKYHDRYGDIWVAWDKNQIKRTDNLNPTESNDIRYSRVNQSEETKAAIEAYRAQTTAEAKAMKAVYEAERKQIVDAYKKQLTSLERQYSAEVASIEGAFKSLVRKYQSMEKHNHWFDLVRIGSSRNTTQARSRSTRKAAPAFA